MKDPKYLRVESSLRQRMQEMALGEKVPAVAALAEEYDVSPGTIHRAIDALVEAGLLERKPNRGAFVSRPSLQVRNIGVLWSDIIEQVTGEALTKHPYTSTILHALQDEAAHLGRNILLASSMDASKPEFLHGRMEVSGVIILHNYDARLVEQYVEAGLPVVLIDPLVCPHGTPYVTSDHFGEFKRAADRLEALGHQRLLHLTLSQHLSIPGLAGEECIFNRVVEERIRGVAVSVKSSSNDMAFRVHRLGKPPWSLEQEPGLHEIMLHFKPTACLCFNDDVAVWFMGYCRDQGWRIPEDISVIGHDDTGTAERLIPSLSSLHAPLEELGREAVRLLNRQVEAESNIGPGIILPGALEERESLSALRPGEV